MLNDKQDDDDNDSSLNEHQVAPSEKEVVDLIANILKSTYATSFVQEYALNALIKLSSRFSQTNTIE